VQTSLLYEHAIKTSLLYDQISASWQAACFGVNPGKMGTLELKCSQLPSPLPQTDARIVISVENWV
jgi:hypothetical protein